MTRAVRQAQGTTPQPFHGISVITAYRDSAATVAKPPGGCDDGWVVVCVDVDLVVGWDQLAWYLTLERDRITNEVTGMEAFYLIDLPDRRRRQPSPRAGRCPSTWVTSSGPSALTLGGVSRR